MSKAKTNWMSLNRGLSSVQSKYIVETLPVILPSKAPDMEEYAPKLGVGEQCLCQPFNDGAALFWLICRWFRVIQTPFHLILRLDDMHVLSVL